MTLLKGQKSLFRYTGIIGSLTALVQAIIWLLFSLSGVVYYLRHSSEEDGVSVANIFHNMYFCRQGGENYPTIPPAYVHGLMWYYVLLSTIWAIISIHLINVFAKWDDTETIRRSTIAWITVTAIVCASDLIIFIIFAVDFRHIITKYSLREQELKNIKLLGKEECLLLRRSMELDPEEVLAATKSKRRAKGRKYNPEQSRIDRLKERNPFVLQERWQGIHNPFEATGEPERGTEEPEIRTEEPVKRTEEPEKTTKFLKLYPDDVKGVAADKDHVHLTMLNRLVFPPAVMMTMASRGYFMWFINTVTAFVLLYFYITRPNRPTLITRVQG